MKPGQAIPKVIRTVKSDAIGALITVGVVLVAALGLLYACSGDGDDDSPGGGDLDYETMTCTQWTKLADDREANTGDALELANQYAEAVDVLPSRAGAETTDFADTLDAECASLRDPSVTLYSRREDVRKTFLILYPDADVR